MSDSAIIIGGGFYGCALALHLKKRFARVTIIESRDGILQRASYINQGRVHGGYHYPRHKLTAERCRANYAQFVHDYADCVNVGQEAYYAIAAKGSKTSASQFWDFCHDIGAPLYPVRPEVRKAFANVEDVFRVDEASFDADKLRKRLAEDVRRAGITICLGAEVDAIFEWNGRVAVRAQFGRGVLRYEADHIYSCVYSHTNELLERSGLPTVPLMHEYTEMPLVGMNPPLSNAAVCVMDGNFCSVSPWKHHHCLHDVELTPNVRSTSLSDLKPRMTNAGEMMVANARRFFSVDGPSTRLWEIKTVLQSNEQDDGRPILVQRNVIPGFHVIVGAKLDNIYDAKDEVDAILDNRPTVGQKLRNVVTA